jgi:prevent-host-death family protein
LTPAGDDQIILVMAKRARRAPAAARQAKTRREAFVSAAEFKATCLKLMDRVRETRVEYVVTKHGEPVAKLVPVDAPKPTSFFGCMKGTVLKYERPLDPLDEDWDVNRE